MEIELNDISHSYSGSEEPVFQNLNFSFKGGRAGLIGDNGSGKTTLFHILVGLVRPQSGVVLFNGEQMKGEQDFVRLRRHVGMVFQHADDQLFSPTVLEDVAFGPLNMNFSIEEARDMARTALAKVGLAGYEDKVTHRLSGGEKRLIALATVLVMEPEILLLDEPTNDLDRASRHRLIDILSGLSQSYLIISHDLDFMTSLADNFYCFEDGTLFHGDRVKVHQHQHAHALGEHEHVHTSEDHPHPLKSVSKE
ncbi:MAG: energy-coupling factor ABC transporter ATP-binding protein [Desulfobulbaceae bacterium]|nr:energy-coupling factor ABC transporter ATP-binding protein [Desulfobulbaceae bacterium]